MDRLELLARGEVMAAGQAGGEADDEEARRELQVTAAALISNVEATLEQQRERPPANVEATLGHQSRERPPTPITVQNAKKKSGGCTLS